MISASPISSIIGLHIELKRANDGKCRACGAVNTVIGEGVAPHAASLRCEDCGCHRGGLPKAVVDGLLETTRLFGRPKVVIRNPKFTASFGANAVSSARANNLNGTKMPVNANAYKETYGGRYLKAADLSETIRCLVTDVNEETLTQKDGSKEPKLILTLSGAPKAELVLNHTNAGALAAMYGADDPNKWIGATVDIFTVPTSMGDGVRLRVIKNKGKPDPISSGPTDPDLDDSLPF